MESVNNLHEFFYKPASLVYKYAFFSYFIFKMTLVLL